jgi:uncharacterized protein YukE
MAGGMEVDPAAIQAFAAFLTDAKNQVEQIRARFDAPNATAEHFGRHWKSEGEEYVNSWSMLAPDLANLTAVLDQVQAQLAQGATLTVAGETTAVGTFKKIESGSESEGN